MYIFVFTEVDCGLAVENNRHSNAVLQTGIRAVSVFIIHCCGGVVKEERQGAVLQTGIRAVSVFIIHCCGGVVKEERKGAVVSAVDSAWSAHHSHSAWQSSTH